MTQLWFPEKQLHIDMKKPTMQDFRNKPQAGQQRQDSAALPNSRHIPCTSSHNLFGRADDTLGRVEPTCWWLKCKKSDFASDLNIWAMRQVRFERRNARQLRRGRVCFARGKGQIMLNAL